MASPTGLWFRFAHRTLLLRGTQRIRDRAGRREISAHLYLGKTLAAQGHFQQAIEELKKSDFTAEPSATIGYVYGRMGRAADARAMLAGLEERSKEG